MLFPVVREDEQSTVELLRRRIGASRRIRRVTVAVNNFSDSAVFDLRAAVPRLNNKLVARFHITEDYELDMSRFGQWHDLEHSGHVSAEQAFISLDRKFRSDLREVLVGMIRARVPARVDRHRIAALDGSD